MTSIALRSHRDERLIGLILELQDRPFPLKTNLNPFVKTVDDLLADAFKLQMDGFTRK